MLHFMEIHEKGSHTVGDVLIKLLHA
uniref:Uncharacterized protein n=1 Tax=Anguilla anguilla TaxID=7936 RepID=A0A0E9U9J5_ANGAN